MTNLTEFTFLSSDGKTRLHAMQWLPVETPRAVLQISHGVAEHIGRYDGFARYLNEQDRRGGPRPSGPRRLSAGGRNPVYFGDGTPGRRWWRTSSCCTSSCGGSFPAYRCASWATAWLLSGPQLPDPLSRHPAGRHYHGYRLAATGQADRRPCCGGGGLRRTGTLRRQQAGERSIFGGYNKAFAPNRTGYDWLSADSENVDRYIADPLCGADATVGLFRQMLHGIAFNQSPKNLARMDSSLPVLLISGDRDRWAIWARASAAPPPPSAKAGLSDVTVKLYPGLRHEILNEGPMRQTVYEDIWHWLEPQLSAR